MAVKYHLCQYNVARAKAPLDDPVMADFVNSHDILYCLSDRSPGFVWRLKPDQDRDVSVRPFEDPQILAGLTVWETLASLRAFTFGKEHAELLRRRREWFEPHSGPSYVLWWKPAGELPTLEEADGRLAHLRASGPSPYAFDFANSFPSPASSLVLGTLGPAGTNSEKAAWDYMAHKGLDDAELRLFDTFEEVADRIVEGSIRKGIICTAYLKYSAVYFERVPRLRVTDAFVNDLHPMVIAVRPGYVQDRIPSFTTQPAIVPLIRKYLARASAPAASNASAAYDTAAGLYDACLTTEVAARAAGLAIMIRLPPMQITFAVFERSDEDRGLPDELWHFFRPELSVTL